jgi:hypothetical protein
MYAKSGEEVTDESELKYLNELYDELQKMIENNKKHLEDIHEYNSKLSKEEIFELARKMDLEQYKYYCLEQFLNDYKDGELGSNLFLKLRETSCRIFSDKQLADLIHYFEYMSIEEMEQFNSMTDEEKIKFIEDFLNTDNISSEENIPDKFVINKIPDEEIILKYDNKFDLEHLNLYVGIANEILTEMIYLKNWKKMNKSQRLEYILGTILIKSTKIPEIQCNNDAVKILNFMGNCIRKGNIEAKDIIMLGVKLADIEFPLNDLVEIIDGIVHNDNKQIEESMIFLMIDLIALSNPFFGFVKSVIVCIKLLDNILTKQSIIDIQGVQAVKTVKIRYNWFKDVKLKDFLFRPIKYLSSLFKREVKIDNDFFGAHGRGKGKHTREATEKAIKDFINQLMYKVFQVLGVPYEFMNLGDPKNRLESYSRMIRIKDSLDKWFEVNGKYLSEKEKNAIKRNRTLSEDDKAYLVLLFNRGLKPSWYFNHKNENPITFFSNLVGQLNNVRNLDDFLHDLYNLFVPQKDKYAELFLSKTMIEPIKRYSKEFGIWSQLKFSQSDLDLWFKLGLISDNLKKELENNLNLNNESVFKRWDDEAIKIYEKARDSRSSKDNKELKEWNERERYLYENHLGKYSNIAILSRINLNILEEEISVGYIFNTIGGCSVGSTSSFLAYLDKNLEVISKNPNYWIEHNFKSFIRNCATSYITTILCSHIMTIPSIMTINGKDLFSNDLLNNISMGLNLIVNAGASVYYEFEKKMKFKEIIKIGLNSLFESTVSNVSRLVINKTLAGVVIKGISAKIVVGLNALTSISLSPMIVASILTGATIFIIKRGILWAIDCIKGLFSKKSEVNIIKYDIENNLVLNKSQIFIFRYKNYLNDTILRNEKYLNNSVTKKQKKSINDTISRNQKYLINNVTKKQNESVKHTISRNQQYLNNSVIKKQKEYFNDTISRNQEFLKDTILRNQEYLKYTISRNKKYLSGSILRNKNNYKN